MAYENIRDFIALLEKNGELIRIKAEVDAELEIAEITDRVSKEKGAANKALLFERVKGLVLSRPHQRLWVHEAHVPGARSGQP